jgi:hypothetical protein
MKITKEELNEKIKLHSLWLIGDKDGVKINMSGADLSGASLSGANLSGASLSGANLSGANLSYTSLSGANLSGASLSGASLSGASLSGASLSGANLSGASLSGASLSGADLRGASLSGARGVVYAQCSFDGHGECGRQLSLTIIAGKPVFFCGCFKGSPDELRAYIANGADEHKASRTLAMEFCLAAVEMSRQKKED